MGFFPESSSQPEIELSTLEELFGFVPRFLRLQGGVPHVLAREIDLLSALLQDETHLSRTHKELILLAVSAARRSSYGVALHEQMLELLGVSETRIAEIVSGGTPEGPDGQLVAVSRKLMLSAIEFGPDDLEALRQAGFTEPQILELVLLAGYEDLFNTIQFGLGAAPDFPARPIPAIALQKKGFEKIAHPEPLESRPLIEDDPDAGEVARAQRGDLVAFEALVERHTQRVYRTLVGLLGNPDDAKDAVQDTFLKAFQSLDRFERRSKFSTWLITIASNTGIQWLRDRKETESLDESDDQEEFRPKQIRAWSDNPEQMYSTTERRILVERAISRLPAKYRVVLLLRDIQQVSTDDAAAALDLSVPALKARLLRGRMMLRENLAPHFSLGAQTA